MSAPEPKLSPYTFDIYTCPGCGNEITVGVYKLITIDAPCPQCFERLLKEYELRKAKGKGSE